MDRQPPGKFICLEGIDGAGKTQISIRLAALLVQRGIDAVFLSRSVAPEQSAAAVRMRILSDLLWNYHPDSGVESLGERHLILLMASWFELYHRWVIAPALKNKQVVITDQGVSKYIARFHAKGIYGVAGLFDNLISPDRVLFLALDPKVAATRKDSYRRTECNSSDVVGSDAFIGFQTSVARELYKLRKKNWFEIYADQPIEEVVLDAAFETEAALRECPLENTL
ncbi:dTMP kinase [Burkholderia stagnalis]